MLSTVLKSHRAITVNIRIMRAFVQLREMLASNKELARRFAQLETRLDKKLTIHDEDIICLTKAGRMPILLTRIHRDVALSHAPRHPS
jgi:hypothetical protein